MSTAATPIAQPSAKPYQPQDTAFQQPSPLKAALTDAVAPAAVCTKADRRIFGRTDKGWATKLVAMAKARRKMISVKQGPSEDKIIDKTPSEAPHHTPTIVRPSLC